MAQEKNWKINSLSSRPLLRIRIKANGKKVMIPLTEVRLHVVSGVACENARTDAKPVEGS